MKFKFWEKEKVVSQEYIELDDRINKLKASISRIENDIMLIEGRFKLYAHKQTKGLKKDEEKDIYNNMLLPE